jgi:hypothetical protein
MMPADELAVDLHDECSRRDHYFKKHRPGGG